jgi:hypothetical protein
MPFSRVHFAIPWSRIGTAHRSCLALLRIPIRS